jgi:hypothetical protein
METTIDYTIPRHDPTSDCHGEPNPYYVCSECETALCACEYGYGHDCEE